MFKKFILFLQLKKFSLKRIKTVSIEQVIGEVLAENKLADKLDEARIKAIWFKELGPLAKPSDELYIKNKVLFVFLSSSVIRNELYMMRSTLVQRLNDEAGKEIITDIVFR